MSIGRSLEALHLGNVMCSKSYDTEWCTGSDPAVPFGGGICRLGTELDQRGDDARVVGWGRTVGCIVGNNFAVDLYEPGCVRRTMPRDFNTKSIFIGETHGRVTPRVESLHGMFAPIDGAATTTNLWGVRWSKLCVNGMRTV